MIIHPLRNPVPDTGSIGCASSTDRPRIGAKYLFARIFRLSGVSGVECITIYSRQGKANKKKARESKQEKTRPCGRGSWVDGGVGLLRETNKKINFQNR